MLSNIEFKVTVRENAMERATQSPGAAVPTMSSLDLLPVLAREGKEMNTASSPMSPQPCSSSQTLCPSTNSSNPLMSSPQDESLSSPSLPPTEESSLSSLSSPPSTPCHQSHPTPNQATQSSNRPALLKWSLPVPAAAARKKKLTVQLKTRRSKPRLAKADLSGKKQKVLEQFFVPAGIKPLDGDAV